MMRLLQSFVFLAGALLVDAGEPTIVVVTSIDFDRIAALGMHVERKRPVHDFTVTYVREPKSGEEIGI